MIKSSFVDTLDTFSGHVESCDSFQACVDLFGLVGVWEQVIELNIFKNWKSSTQVSMAQWIEAQRRRSSITVDISYLSLSEKIGQVQVI